ncbi:helix-turn-helix domain-containing protein [Sphingopyxis sp. OAS728]|uniref:helix-turn-helix domain-containing protein n=1 Tax=Sphingopyxis sp. OAS728 TaxID=2663823 RepID=UPI00178BB1BC|nr:helix-turn-helix domain-containing protein [Sphingopyxis sp. OAS728]
MVISAYLDAPAAGRRRRTVRRKLHLSAAGAHSAGADIHVLIHNISRSGMLIECDSPLAVDDQIEIELPHAGSVSTMIVWASDNMFGCQFAAPISSAALSAAQLRSEVVENVIEPALASPGATALHSSDVRFGANLKRLRIAKGLSQARVGAELGVSGPSISGWESGRARPKNDRLTALAALLEVPVAQLLVDLAADPAEVLISQGREKIARATGASPGKIRIFIEID